ncbi:MAG: choice-of-anchor Q domain-containing protein [Dokdonella sp.]
MNKLALILFVAAIAGDAFAANINIGPNGCTLADAISAANVNVPVGNCAAGSGSDFIIAPDGWVVTLTSDLPNIVSDMTIRSSTSAGIFYVLGNDQRRVFKVTGSNTELTLQRVEVGGGRVGLLDGYGAGMRIENATVRLEDSVVISNEDTQGFGSGIFVTGGDLTLDRSTVRSNVNGPGVYAVNSSVHVVDSQFVQNPRGGLELSNSDLLVERSLFDERFFGIRGAQSTAQLINSTFATTIPNLDGSPGSFLFSQTSVVSINHVTTVTEFDVRDSFLSASNSVVVRCNLVASTILLNTGNASYFGNCLGSMAVFELLPLAANGGPTRTKAIGQANSGAINGGNPTYCTAVDQRGEPRGASCDVGAYEATGLADVEVTARLQTAAPYVSNQPIVMFADITNHGPGPATNILVDIDADHAFITSANSPYCNAIPCVITSIQPGQTLSVPIQMTLGNFFNSPFSIELSAHTTASSTYSDANENDPLGNNFDTVSHAINEGADLSIIMNRVTNGPFFIGQVIQYQATIQNFGPQTSNGTQLQFTPTGLGSVSFTGCSSTSGLNCNIANIANGSSRNVTIQGTVTASQFNAVATVSASQVDINPFNNVDNTGNGGGTTTADVSVSAAILTSPPVYSLDYIAFNITLATGNSAASNIQIDVDFPGADYIDIQGCADFPCVIPQLAANSQLVLLAQYFAPLAVPGVVDTLSIGVRATPGQQDTNPSNNEVVLVRALNPTADIVAQLSLISTPPFYPGQEIQYRLGVSNDGPNTATSVNITATPQNLSLLSAYGVLCPTVSCTIPQFNAFDGETITLVYRINTLGAFNLTATANATQHDNAAANNTDSSNNGGTAIAPPGSDQIFFNGFDSP